MPRSIPHCQCGQVGHTIRSCPQQGYKRCVVSGSTHHTNYGIKVSAIRQALGIGNLITIDTNILAELHLFHSFYGLHAMRAIQTDRQYEVLKYCLTMWPLCPISEWIAKHRRLWNSYIFVDPLNGTFARYYLGAWLESWYYEHNQCCYICQEYLCPIPDSTNSGYYMKKSISMFCRPSS